MATSGGSDGGAPAGRVPRARSWRVGRARPGTMRLWTLQPWVVWERLQQEGSLYVDPDLTEPFLRDAYDWIRGQMAQRIPDYQGHYPWWAEPEKPDLRRAAYYWTRRHEQRRARIELAVEPERVLISDVDAWVNVLSGYLVPLTLSEVHAWDAQLAAAGLDGSQRNLPEPWESRKRASWERIFDFDAMESGDIWLAPHRLQAVIERLDLRDVVAVTDFQARRSKRDRDIEG